MTPEMIQELLAEMGEKLTTAQKKAVLRKAASFRWKYPMAVELRLNQALVTLLTPVRDAVVDFVTSHEEVVTKKDAFEDDLTKKLEDEDGFILLFFTKQWQQASFQHYLDNIFTLLKKHSESELVRYFEKVLGKKVPASIPNWSIHKSVFKTTFENRAKQAYKGTFEKIREYVIKAVQEKYPLDDIVEGVLRINSSLTTSKASFIARDLAGTYNSAVSREVFTSMLGTDLYIWTTRADERVRGRPEGLYPGAVPDHWVMEQKLCKWEDASVFSVDGGVLWTPRPLEAPKKHPGEDHGCRCSATPYMAHLISKALGLAS